MNKYGRQAQEAWKAASPTRYSQIQNPEEFFTKLGEEAQEQVDELLPKIAGPDPKGESYLEKEGRLKPGGTVLESATDKTGVSHAIPCAL